MTESTDPSAGPTKNQAVDKSLLHGIAWTGTVRWSTQLLSWAATLVVARFLSPADYGLVNMALVYLGLVQLVNELGLGVAIVQRRDIDESRIAKLGGLSILVGLLFFVLSVLVATPYANFYSEPAVRGIVVVLSLDFIINGFLVVPRSVLTRELQFNKVAWIDGGNALVQIVVTLLLAWLGFGYWALAWGPIAGRTGATCIALALRPHPYRWPGDVKDILGDVAFGTRILVAQVTWYVYSHADFLVVGRILGKTVLGFYSWAWYIASIPVERIVALLLQVTLGVFSAVQEDKPALRRYLKHLTAGIAYLSFPAAIGLAIVADEFVLAVLGAKWEGAIVPMRILALYAGFRAITTLFSQLLIAIGHERRNMHFNIFATIIFPILFVFATRWGNTGVAFVWAVAYPALVIPFYVRYSLRAIEMPAREFLDAIWPALSASLVMALAVLASRTLLPSSLPVSVTFFINVTVGGLVYVGYLLGVYRDRLEAAIAFVKQVRGRG